MKVNNMSKQVYFVLEQKADYSVFVVFASRDSMSATAAMKQYAKDTTDSQFKVENLSVDEGLTDDVCVVLEQRKDDSVYLVYAGREDEAEAFANTQRKKNPGLNYKSGIIQLSSPSSK